MELFGRSLGIGERTTLRQKVASYPDGTPISVAVRAVKGVGDGPVISLLGVQHGDEYCGIEVVNRLLGGLDPESLSGTIIGVPVSNPLAFNAGMRFSPLRPRATRT